MDIAAVLAAAVQAQASDVHLQEGRLPLLRLGAELFPWGNHRVGGEDISAWLQTLGQPFDGRPYVSTAFSWDGRVRCRVHGSKPAFTSSCGYCIPSIRCRLTVTNYCCGG